MLCKTQIENGEGFERRVSLSKYNDGKFHPFTGTYVKTSVANIPGFMPTKTFLLRNIYDNNHNFVAQHMWIKCTKDMPHLTSQTPVSFDAKVYVYITGIQSYGNVKHNFLTKYGLDKASNIKSLNVNSKALN